MANLDRNGSCLCGAVTLTLRITSPSVSACHCATCRKWGGGPLLVAEGELAQLSGEQQVRIHDSSEWAERGFCGQCGSHLFYRLKSNGHHAVPVGLLDDHGDWQFDSQIFVDSRPAYYCFANQTRVLTGEQVFTEFEQG